METDCLVYGAVIAAVVSFLGRWEFFRTKPKTWAFIASMVAAAWPYLKDHSVPIGVRLGLALLACTAVTLAASIATYEVARSGLREVGLAPKKGS